MKALLILMRSECRRAGHWLVVCLAFGAAVPAFPARAETNAPPTLSSNRFLLVLDTSAAMKHKLPEMLRAVDQIVDSSAGGILRNGDSLGLWTFNQEVYAQFPLQTWGKISPAEISQRIKNFMAHQRFMNSARLGQAVQEIAGVVRASDIITVVLVYGGEEPIKGTPFDVQINRFLKANVKASSGKGVPAVVVLEAQAGSVFDYAVSAAPWPVDFPPLPKPPPEPKPETPEPPVVVKPPAPVVKLPPLILSGHKPTNAAPPPLPPAAVAVVPVQKNLPPAVAVPPPSVPAATPAPVTPPPEPGPAPMATPPAAVVATPMPAPPTTPEPLPASVAPTPVSNETPASPAPNQGTLEAASPAVTGRTNAPAPEATPALAEAVLPAPQRPLGFLIAGVALALVALGLIGWMVARNRHQAGASYISRSIIDKK